MVDKYMFSDDDDHTRQNCEFSDCNGVQGDRSVVRTVLWPFSGNRNITSPGLSNSLTWGRGYMNAGCLSP